MRTVSYHLILDLILSDERFLLDDNLLMDVIRSACVESGLKIVKEDFYKFNPHGFTGMFILSTSHVAFHTFPEHKLIYIDIFSCDRKRKVVETGNRIIKYLKPKKYKMILFKRSKSEIVSQNFK
ncbi:MAG TPA: adenosylmethionine decarboxylase [Firmicutes bacterium]|nr:adenosylmethionine decarboxylase [Bacillota bacterium]